MQPGLVRGSWHRPCCRLGPGWSSGFLGSPSPPPPEPEKQCSSLRPRPGVSVWLLLGEVSPGPTLTRGAAAEKEGLASPGAAPHRRGPTCAGMFSVLPLSVSPPVYSREGHFVEQSNLCFKRS